MLKRQRPISPPPTFPTAPLVIDLPVDFVGRDTKRRRTLPPVLDGACRGWAQALPLSINSVEDDGEEDYISDDEIENIAPNFSINCSLAHQQQPGDKTEYASTNSFLRELHTLQQHRLLSSSLPPPSMSSSSFLCGSNSKDAHSSNILSYPPLTKGHFNLPPQLERPRDMPPTPIAKLSRQQSHGQPIDEIHSVTEHYEGTNKYVGFTDAVQQSSY
jgi:hypothetical protein